MEAQHDVHRSAAFGHLDVAALYVRAASESLLGDLLEQYSAEPFARMVMAPGGHGEFSRARRARWQSPWAF
jgi:hypothetical protein